MLIFLLIVIKIGVHNTVLRCDNDASTTQRSKATDNIFNQIARTPKYNLKPYKLGSGAFMVI